ncbi:MAG TPA: class I SAM-dependent methyltransferase [Vicinamibacterales bacterium]|nr:class I SAM-dependent methyltransferase [Vicinamibacterales bacterium]
MTAASRPEYEPGSFRDRSARVFFGEDGAVFRALSGAALEDWNALAATRFFRTFTADGRLVATERASDEAARLASLDGCWAAVLRHEAIPFVSYPYEWSFGMLKDASLLQLDLLLAALDEGMILKDGTPYNVQWIGTRPVFIDIGSIARLRPGEPWAGYRQFCRLCLYPLLLQAYKNVSAQAWLRGSLEGISAEACSRLMSARDLLRPGVLTHVSLQAQAEARAATATRNVKEELRRAGFNQALIRANVQRLRKLVSGLEWGQQRSAWSEYADHNTYQPQEAAQKAAFVQRAAAARPRNLVWDLGSNTGRFAQLAAAHARYVVAVDADELSVERMYRRLSAEGVRNVLPLVGNIADPSPGLGWRGRERLPLPDRGRPDLVLNLALIHHVVLGANVPLGEYIDWLAGLGGDVVIEWVGRSDPMVEALLRHKEDLFDDYDHAYFESRLASRFEVVERQALSSGTRTLYHAVPRRGSSGGA